MSSDLEEAYTEDQGTYRLNGRTWYRLYKAPAPRYIVKDGKAVLVPPPEGGYVYLTKRSKPEFVLARDFVDHNVLDKDGNPKIKKSFTGFKSLKEMSDFAALNPDDSYYEYLQSTQGERKLYFDIDGKSVPMSDVAAWRSYFHRHLGALTDVLTKLFAEYDHPYDSSDYRIYTSCGEDKGRYKFSFHYVVTGYRAHTFEHVAHICREVNRRIAQNAQYYGLCIDNVYPGFLDFAPYNCNQAFRLYGSCKAGSSRSKKILNLSEVEGEYTVFDVNGTPTQCTRPLSVSTFTPFSVESMILAPPKGDRPQLYAPFCPIPPAPVSTYEAGQTLEGQRMLDAFVAFEKAYPMLKGVYEFGSGNKLKRVMPALCPVCADNCFHQNENAYLNVSRTGKVYFKCLRNSRQDIVRGIVIPEEEEEESEEEEGEEEKEEEEAAPVAPSSKEQVIEAKEQDRAMTNKHCRIAYREAEVDGELILDGLSEGMEDALTAFRSDIGFIDPDNYGHEVTKDTIKAAEGGIDRPNSDVTALITVIERLTDLADKIALNYKLYNGRIVLFRNMDKTVKDATYDFSWWKPSIKKYVKDKITASELLSGRYIDGVKYKGGKFPKKFSDQLKARIRSDVDVRRMRVKRRHDLLFTKLGDVCHIPYFRGQPTTLPNLTSVNIFTGFKANPLKFLHTNGRRNNLRFGDFMRHELLEIVYILIQHGIAAGVIVDAERAMDFMAYPFFHFTCPKTGKAMVVIGDYGTGKSTLGNILADIYGHLGINTNMQRMTSRFNGILAHRMFAMLEEPEPGHNADGTATAAQKAAARNYSSRFKEFVTGENTILEDKNENERSAKLSLNFFLSSNNFDIAVLEVSETRKDRRPIIYDSRTCCLHIKPDNTRFYYFYATGESDKCVDISGQLLNPQPSPAQIKIDKDRFYSYLYYCRAQPDFTSLFAASLLAYAEEYDTSRILHYVQPADHPVVKRMRENQISNVTRFMNYLCDDEFDYNGNIAFHPYGCQELAPHMVPVGNTNPGCYFAPKTTLYDLFAKWFTRFIGRNPPNETDFWKDIKAYASRNPSKVSLRFSRTVNGRIVDNRPSFNGGKNLTGIGFITYSTLRIGVDPNFSYCIPHNPPQTTSNTVTKPETPVPDPLPTSYTKPNTTLTSAPSPFPTILKADVHNPLSGIVQLPEIVNKIAQVVPPKPMFTEEAVEEMIQRAVAKALAAQQRT